jgi:hypothetical protein
MNLQTIFNNNDIIVELWKHVNVDTMKCLSIVSKNYNSQFKKMSDIDYLSRIYKENNNNLSSFVLKTCKENCKKYNYPTPRFINIFCAFIDNKVSEKEKNNIEDDIYIIYYWIIMLLHIVNNNYNQILIITKKINYENKLNKSITQLFLKILNESKCKIFSRYSLNKCKLIRYLSVGYFLVFSKYQFKTNKDFVRTVQMKQTELINAIRDFEFAPKKWLFPKRFCLKLIEIFEE